jgi:hypothetical protein
MKQYASIQVVAYTTSLSFLQKKRRLDSRLFTITDNRFMNLVPLIFNPYLLMIYPSNCPLT